MVATHAYIAFPKHGLHCSLSSTSSRAQRVVSTRPAPSSVALHSQTFVKVRAGPEGDYPAAQNATATPAQRPPVRRPPVSSGTSSVGNQDSSLQTVFVEDKDVSVEGVAKVDKEESARPSWGRIGFLAGGDILVLLAFAALGRMSHGMSVFDWDALRTADPFIAGWLVGSYFLGGYGPEGQGVNGFQAAVLATAKSWAVGIPLGLAIRGVTTGHTPAQPFVLISLASTLVLLVGWRAAFTTAFPNDEQSKRKKSGDRQGSVFELFELLASLVKRW